MSNSSDRVSTRITPACSNSTFTPASSIGVAPAAIAASAPACRPLFTAITGLVRASRLASRPNLRGLPKVSRYSRTRSVPGSVCQYCSRSLPETSARLPAETKVDSPSPRSLAAARIAMPSAPDWAKKPARPRPGTSGARVALSRTAGSVFATPRAFGPITRMPCALASVTSRRWAAVPSRPTSAKPELSTSSAATPFARQESMTWSMSSAGTATTARSTSSGMSVTEP